MNATRATRRRTNMRWPIIGLFLFTAVLSVPHSAQALQVQICTPNCSTPGATTTSVSSATVATQDSTGSWVNSVPIASFPFGVFTITATVTSTQSDTLQKITFNPTTIKANSGCSTTAPCTIEIVATSDTTDFPVAKPVGGYPAGVFMLGSFTGPQAVGNGDTISLTGASSGLTTSTSDVARSVVNTDVVNAMPGTDPGNTGNSLPSPCTGNPTCVFMATTLKKGF